MPVPVWGPATSLRFGGRKKGEGAPGRPLPPASAGPDSGAGPAAHRPGSRLTAVAGGALRAFCLGGFRVGRTCSEKAKVRCNLSKSCFLGGLWFFSFVWFFWCREGGLAQRGIGSGEAGRCRCRGSGSENCCSLTFLHYIMSNLPQSSVMKNSHASDFSGTQNLCTAPDPLLLRGSFPSKIFSLTRPGSRARLDTGVGGCGITRDLLREGGWDVFNRFGVGWRN